MPSAESTHGELLAQGRAADVFAIGPDRVLRRYREGEGGDVTAEAAAMEHARRHGFPVPEVHDVCDRDLVLERVDGPTMMVDLSRRPWRVRAHGATLAELHQRLHCIPAPEGIRSPFDRGSSLVHFDLHPDNVLLSPSGPMVIDWSNASRSDGADDVALTWVIMATSVIPGPQPFRTLARAGRDLLVNAFLAGVDADAARARLPEIAERRLRTDPHLLEPERRALAGLAGI
jgi:aminoglycoside phosphotransferase (APT) family kinase protein